MLLDLLFWALDNPDKYGKGPNLVVISKSIKEETDFVTTLEALKGRHFNVFLALPDKFQPGELRPRVNARIQSRTVMRPSSKQYSPER
ncbi:hypothetical protein ISN45_Aa05g030250 [Arabidopsis thaliana x Arabidopsis arenosa]|uniref:NYN domain-containing protein n=1 Tax=Arabidopsis thaliana x Arabidopsis arenosa TaxID=1240361 RepID=A0A8T1ZSI6_9BRAS|nr:hypothetical protein ISN45_Aa05g030250 [Arabidopsis thaliana x Arabidopsis arenosa]